jgi:hypothetical protein
MLPSEASSAISGFWSLTRVSSTPLSYMAAGVQSEWAAITEDKSLLMTETDQIRSSPVTQLRSRVPAAIDTDIEKDWFSKSQALLASGKQKGKRTTHEARKTQHRHHQLLGRLLERQGRFPPHACIGPERDEERVV